MTYVIYRCCNDECSEAWRGRWVEDTGETDPRCEGVVYMHHSDPRFPEGIDPGPDGWAFVPCGRGLAIERNLDPSR